MIRIDHDYDEAVADLRDGATVLIGGFGPAGEPAELIDAVRRSGAQGLTIVNNNAGNGRQGLAALLAAGQVSKIICSYPRQVDSFVFDGLYRSGDIELELVPQGNLAERIRAAGAGIGAFFCPTSVGTPLAKGKEHRVIAGRAYVLEYPIGGDFALIKAHRADTIGNLVYRKTARNFGPLMAMAATTTVAQVDEIVEAGVIDPEAVVTPGIYVDRVVCPIPLGRRRQMTREQPRRNPLSRDQLARLVAADLPAGSYVNLGIGLPTIVADYLPIDSGIMLHTENGMLGMGRVALPHEVDLDLVNAGKIPVTEAAGASYFHHADSFALIRGGHLDVCVLGAFQVSVTGDLANWHTGETDAIPAVGGAMDLAVGARSVYVMMNLFTKGGDSKIVATCDYPLTAVGCVDRVYTDHAVFTIGADGLQVRETYGCTLSELRARVPADLMP